MIMNMHTRSCKVSLLCGITLNECAGVEDNEYVYEVVQGKFVVWNYFKRMCRC